MIQTSIQARRILWSIATSLLALIALPASAQVQVQLLHPTNTVWRYQTNLLEQQAAGTDWINPGFDDSMWLEGRGLFGNDALIYPYAFNTPVPLPAPIGLYFRTHFNWIGSSTAVVLRGTNYVDDGSIIYLNGVEIARFNMGPEANAGTPDILAPFANPGGYPNVNGGEPVLVRVEMALDSLTNGNVNPLVSGDNVIAVQVHQNSVISSDRVFGLSLFAASCAAPCFTFSQPTNRMVLEGRSTTFTVVEQCAVPTPSFQWYRDTGFGEELIPGATSASYALTNVSIIDWGVYYAKATTPCGTVSSRQATLTVISGPNSPSLLSGRLGANNLEIIVTADEALCADDSCPGDATLTFCWEIFIEGNESDQLNIVNVTVSGSVLTFTLDAGTPWLPDTRYVVRLVPYFGSVGDLDGNLLLGGDPNSSVTTPSVNSAISVKGPFMRSDLYTFDTPPNQFEFSTFTWVGVAATATTVAALGSAVQTLDASLINQHLPEALGNPPGGFGTARYASDTKNLITSPAGVLGHVILARLRNDTGKPQPFLELTYTLTNRVSNTVEEIPGIQVYYSRSGAPDTWVPIQIFPNERTTGPKTGYIELSSLPWPAGTEMYLLFVDDNTGGIEDIYELDNFRVIGGIIDCFEPIPPVLVRAASRDNTTIVLTFNERMAAGAATTAPYTVSGATVTAAAFNNASQTEVTLTTTPRAAGNSAVTITGVTDDGSLCPASFISPNPTVVRLTTVQKVVDWNAPWQFNTNPLDNHPDWQTTGAGGWLTGNGLFGMETSAAATNAFPVPIATFIPTPTIHGDMLTTYFRKSVTLPVLSPGQSYALGYYVDDGAVFYLDGVEIGRFNMPSGPVSYFTFASAELPEGMLHSLPFNASAGDHILAVELHQTSLSNSDTVFGAQLLIVPTASPALNIVHSGTNAVVSWNADASWMLVGSTNVGGPYAPLVPTTRDSLIRPIATPATQFYKLNYVPQP